MSAIIAVNPAYHRELIDGQEVEKPLPNRPHGIIQMFLIQWFGLHLPKTFDAIPELNVICGSDRLVPDVTVAPVSARCANGDLVDPPDLAIEIFSPGQSLTSILDKCNRLLGAGTVMCWIIWPEKRRAWNYSLDDRREISDSYPDLSFGSLNEGLSSMIERLQIHEVWAELDRRAL